MSILSNPNFPSHTLMMDTIEGFAGRAVKLVRFVHSIGKEMNVKLEVVLCGKPFPCVNCSGLLIDQGIFNRSSRDCAWVKAVENAAAMGGKVPQDVKEFVQNIRTSWEKLNNAERVVS